MKTSVMDSDVTVPEEPEAHAVLVFRLLCSLSLTDSFYAAGITIQQP